MPPERDQLIQDVMCAARRQFADAVLLNVLVADSLGLSVRETQFLNLLDLRGPQTAGQLARETGLSTGSVTGVLDRLEQAGFAARHRSPTDRRKVVVTLNAERIAREIAPLYAGKAEDLSQVLAQYALPELRVIAQFMARLSSPPEVARGRATK